MLSNRYLSNRNLLVFQIILLLAFIWLYVFTIPYLTYGVIKEQQHYLCVSWHMWMSHQWVLLHSDAGVYINKPPLLFWITNIVWLVFGVHNWTLRAIPAFFSVSSVLLLFVFFRQLWPNLKSYAWIAPLFFLFNWYVLHYAPLYMHDFLLMAFLILSLNGLMLARKRFVLGFALYGLALALGVLAKGPVVLVFCIPAALLAPLGFTVTKKTLLRWYAGFVFSLIVMAAILAAWLIPFWQQIQLHHLEKQLMIKLFGGNHQYTSKPVWNYLAVLLPMLLPWVVWPALYKSIYLKWRDIKSNKNIAWMVATFLAVFIIMSFIGAKADRYIMPIAVYFAICAAYFVASAHQSGGKVGWRAYPLWIFCVIFSFALILVAPHAPRILHKYANYTGLPFAILGAVLFILAITALRIKTMTLQKSLLLQMLFMFIAYSGFALIVVRTDMKSHHLARLEKISNQYVKQGKLVAYQYAYGGYRYRVGKGMMPNGPVLKNAKATNAWLRNNKKGVVIAKVPINAKIKNVILTLPFDREKKMVLISLSKSDTNS